MGLSRYEQETIINFNKDEDMAYVFTYEKTWQGHIEQHLGIKPYDVNSFGGKWYKVPKNSISKPRAKRTGKALSPERKAQMRSGLQVYRANRKTTRLKEAKHGKA